MKEICWECTGAGIMAGNYPCKVCKGTGYIKIKNPKKTTNYGNSNSKRT